MVELSRLGDPEQEHGSCMEPNCPVKDFHDVGLSWIMTPSSVHTLEQSPPTLSPDLATNRFLPIRSCKSKFNKHFHIETCLYGIGLRGSQLPCIRKLKVTTECWDTTRKKAREWQANLDMQHHSSTLWKSAIGVTPPCSSVWKRSCLS
jgi:hypothetical protein